MNDRKSKIKFIRDAVLNDDTGFVIITFRKGNKKDIDLDVLAKRTDSKAINSKISLIEAAVSYFILKYLHIKEVTNGDKNQPGYPFPSPSDN